MQAVCVYCGSSSGFDPQYAEASRRLGALLAESDLTLVYGGGRVGLMGVLADAVLAARGQVIGVIPVALKTTELAHPGLTDLRIVQSMHERKALMADLSDGFLALPGGFGTLDELCEILTWVQLGIHRKPCGILNTSGYFDHLIALFDHAVTCGFLKPQHRDMLLVGSDPARLLTQLLEHVPPALGKWIPPSAPPP